MTREPIHPGVQLKEELEAIGISPSELARKLDMDPLELDDIIDGRRGITARTAILFGHWFGTSGAFWMNLQSMYELRLAERALAASLKKLPTLKSSAA